MGVDLTLYVVNHDNPKYPLATVVLPLARDYGLQDKLESIVAERLADAYPGISVNGYFQDNYGPAPESDAYGNQLRYLQACQIVDALWSEFGDFELGSPFNVAAVKYLAALPGATKVILYWH